MRFIARGSKTRTRLQVTIDADSTAEAEVAAQTWAQHHRLTEHSVSPDHANLKVVDGQVLVLESVFDDTYIPFLEQIPWRVESGPGRKWHISPLNDAADLCMQAVGTPPAFDRKRDAEGWLTHSLRTHLPL